MTIQMTESQNCPKCQGTLPADSPSGICPKCLLLAGLGPDDSQTAAASTKTSAFTPPTPDELSAMFPQLEIIELIGRGGMGAVYRARQPALNRDVAVKILPPEVGADSAFEERFTREAQALAQLSHQNIVSVFDFGESNGLWYFIMEYIDGVNLRQLIAEQRMTSEEALTIIPQICEALQFAHAEGVVHRDIKPENILIDRRGRAKIADFGLAKLLNQEPRQANLTGSLQVMGTPHYMAPEQMQGAASVDHRADIFSLGVVLYEMLTGELPIGRFQPPSRKAQVDNRLDEVVMRALESEPERRYQQVRDVQTDVESISSAPPRLDARGYVDDVPPTQVSSRPPKPSPISSQRPRFSIKAILGAFWAFMPILIIIPSLMLVRTEAEPAGMTMASPSSVGLAMAQPSIMLVILQWFLLLVVLPLGLSAPIGTTVLGMLAVRDIRHSEGRIVGMPLAVADALFYPLLFLDGLIFAFVGAAFVLIISVLNSFGFQAGIAYIYLMLALLVFGVPLCLLADFFIVRTAWRKATQ